jgi:murein DD-endopeptidase MepM/ murein hydrolase activator NlpD
MLGPGPRRRVRRPDSVRPRRTERRNGAGLPAIQALARLKRSPRANEPSEGSLDACAGNVPSARLFARGEREPRWSPDSARAHGRAVSIGRPRPRSNSGITADVRRHFLIAAFGIVLAAGAMIASPSLSASSVPLPGGTVVGAVGGATATPGQVGNRAQPAGPGSASGAGSPSGAVAAAVQGQPGHGRQPPPAAPDPASLSGYVWPLPHGRITNPFGPDWYSDNTVNGVRFHDGLDIATFCGDRIVAAHDGTVLAAGRKVDPWMGWIGSLAPSVARRDKYSLWGELPIIIVIDDGNGYRSIYAHFSKIAVKVGQTIKAGEFIGWEGRTGYATGCHLHYGLFSPYDLDRFGLRADVVKRTRLPALEIARINPLLVLPPRPSVQPVKPLVAPTNEGPGG